MKWRVDVAHCEPHSSANFSAPLSPLDGNIVLFKHNSLSTKYENHRNTCYPTPPKDNKFYKKKGGEGDEFL